MSKKVKRKRSPKKLQVQMQPFHLSKEENDERVKRLARNILRALEGSMKRDKQGKEKIEDILKPDFEKLFGK